MAFNSLISWLFQPLVVGTISFIFVAVGTWMVVRDLMRDRRALSTMFSKTAVPAAPVASPATATPVASATSQMRAETVVAVPPPPTAAAVPPPIQAFPLIAQAIADIRGEFARDDDGATAPRDASMEISWRALAPRVDRLMKDVEPALDPVRIFLSPPGEPRWALSNHAFGTYRRVNLDGESMAWLRSEITSEGQLRFRLRSHRPEMALLNAEAACDLGRLNTPELTRALSAALMPIVRYATWIEAKPADTPLDRPVLEQILHRATEIANGALVEAHARFRRHSQSDAAVGSAPRFVIDILVDGRQVGLMHIDEVGDHVEISVGVPDPHRLDLARRQQLASERLAAYELAEAMATSAWPALAHALGAEARPMASAPFKL